MKRAPPWTCLYIVWPTFLTAMHLPALPRTHLVLPAQVPHRRTTPRRPSGTLYLIYKYIICTFIFIYHFIDKLSTSCFGPMVERRGRRAWEDKFPGPVLFEGPDTGETHNKKFKKNQRLLLYLNSIFNILRYYNRAWNGWELIGTPLPFGKSGNAALPFFREKKFPYFCVKFIYIHNTNMI